MGVQIPSSFLKILDFKPLQTKVRVLPWQINNTFIKMLILLKCTILPRFAPVYPACFLGVTAFTLSQFSRNRAKWSKLGQAVVVKW